VGKNYLENDFGSSLGKFKVVDKLEKRKYLLNCLEQRTGRILKFDSLFGHFWDMTITWGRTKLIS
jgi:hypothetical protein